ncbi:type II secretion system F family protein [Yersinia sp. Marseille-Q3913]|uniref:type II secretion system F family protein n=1 Tax=Yersinia sp. Marseille-Q3913 TaxID=2830769 RepID=UPI001BAEE42C|nr:type II secretion system F family protein [Yersinia sp. Marseille-Q3913]MBS0054006.1 type II secretion system F family protein [Yersinia sp. Marseille-Q3913]
MTYYIILLFGILLLILNSLKWIKIKNSINNTEKKKFNKNFQLVNLFRKTLLEWTNYLSYIIKHKNSKHILIPIIYSVCVYVANFNWFHINVIIVSFFILISVVYLQLMLSRKMHHDLFNQNFPEVLLIVNMAASSGASINQILERCGNEINGPLGDELTLIYRKLNLGESPETVFYDAYKRLHYPEFYFLTTIILLNLQQGGQLRELTNRLSTVITKNKTSEQKKAVMTAQVRMSVNIISLMPIAFSLLLYFMDPTTIESMWNHPIGKAIFYYIITSEIIGLVIIRKMLRKTL